eukprot:486696-Pelagomonas_calceolata.AAC.2
MPPSETTDFAASHSANTLFSQLHLPHAGLCAEQSCVTLAGGSGSGLLRLTLHTQAGGGQAVCIAPADVTDPGCPSQIVRGAMDAFGRIDYLINNAGFTWDGVIQKMTPEQWETMLLVRAAVRAAIRVAIRAPCSRYGHLSMQRKAAKGGEKRSHVAYFQPTG